jgi:hypothetical protein
VSIEDKSLQHRPHVCTTNVLENMFCTRACIEFTCCIPFLKNYKPVIDIVSAKLQQVITFENSAQHVISVLIQKDDVISDNFYVEHMPSLLQDQKLESLEKFTLSTRGMGKNLCKILP